MDRILSVEVEEREAELRQRVRGVSAVLDKAELEIHMGCFALYTRAAKVDLAVPLDHGIRPRRNAGLQLRLVFRDIAYYQVDEHVADPPHLGPPKCLRGRVSVRP